MIRIPNISIYIQNNYKIDICELLFIITSQIDITLKIPKINDHLTSFLTVIPLQLLAYHVASLKNLDIDKPRNLAKSVTVE